MSGKTGQSALSVRQAYGKLKGSRDYNALVEYYTSGTLPDILEVSRQENPNSSFIAWMLGPKGGLGLGGRPLKLLIKTVFAAADTHVKAVKSPAAIPNLIWESERELRERLAAGAYSILPDSTAVVREKLFPGNRRGDIYIETEARLEGASPRSVRLTVLIENKIYSGEQENQTPDYADAVISGALSSPREDSFCLLAYLAPAGAKPPKSRQFVPVTYQMLMDGVIQPCLDDAALAGKPGAYLEEYARSLCGARRFSISPHQDEGEPLRILAVSKRELALSEAVMGTFGNELRTLMEAFSKSGDLRVFPDARRDVIYAVANALCMLDKEHLALYRRAMQKAQPREEYEFRYGGCEQTFKSNCRAQRAIGWLAHEMIKDYAENGEGRGKSFEEIRLALHSALPESARGFAREMVLSAEEIAQISKTEKGFDRKKTVSARMTRENWFTRPGDGIQAADTLFYTAKYYGAEQVTVIAKALGLSEKLVRIQTAGNK